MISALSAPSSVPADDLLEISEMTRNTGSGPAAPSTTRFYLSPTPQLAPGMAGWDWFGLQLDDGSELMLYYLRKALPYASVRS